MERKMEIESEKESREPELTKCETCLSFIPACGGWCIPTASPETSVMRHFSNENTVFRFFARSYRIRKYAEHSYFCRMGGATGFKCGERHRASIMLLALFCSCSAWACMVCATLGVSYRAHIIKKLSWARLKWADQINLGVRLTVDFGINIYVSQLWGLTQLPDGRYVLDPNGYIEEKIEWGDDGSCSFSGDRIFASNTTAAELEKFCQRCESASVPTSIFIIMAMILQFLQVKKNLQRLTPYGDINCQKVNGLIGAGIGIITGVSSLITWLEGCWSFFPTALQLQAIVPNNPANEVGFSLISSQELGVGCAVMISAVLTKSVDMFCHFMVPTPKAKQLPAEPGLTMVDYCLRCPEKTRFGQPVE